MSKTIVIQIGNSDNKLTQHGWSNFVKYLWAELDTPAVQVHFSGFSPGDARWQNHCMVFEVDHAALGYEDFEDYLNDLRFILGSAARKYNQSSIALLVGETEFIPFNYKTKEIQDALSGNSNEEDSDEEVGRQALRTLGLRQEAGSQGNRQGLHIVHDEDDFDGYASKEDQLAAYSEEDRRDPNRQEDHLRPV